MLKIKPFLSILLAAPAFSFAQSGAYNAPQSPRQANASSAAQAQVPDPQLLQRSGGSLFKASLAQQPDPGRARLTAVSFFAVPAPEPRTLKKQDLVTIIIREQSEFSSEGSAQLSKDMALQAEITDFIKLNLANLAVDPGGIGGVAPRIDLSANREFNGQATIDRTDEFTARVTARVIDVKPNGTLVLEGRKRIVTDEETQEFLLTGLCRAEDVAADNTILSTQLADIDLRKNHKGSVRDTTKRGAVPRFVDWLNPF